MANKLGLRLYPYLGVEVGRYYRSPLRVGLLHGDEADRIARGSTLPTPYSSHCGEDEELCGRLGAEEEEGGEGQGEADRPHAARRSGQDDGGR